MTKTEIPKKTGIMGKYYIFALYIVIIVLLNFVGRTAFFRLDLTANGLYSLSPASKEAVSTLKEPLTINVFFSKNLPYPYNNIEPYLHDLMEAYESEAKNNLSYRFYDVTPEEEGSELAQEKVENRKLAQSYGINPVNVQKIEADESKVQRAYMGMVLIHGDVMEKVPAITSTEGLEYKVTSAIRKMNNKISALVSLPEKIRVTLIYSSAIERIAPLIRLEGFQGLKQKVAETVDRLNAKTFNQLLFQYVDPSGGEGTPEQLKPFQRFGLQWPEIKTPEGAIIPAGNAILALGLSHAGKSVEWNLLSRKMALSERGLEEQYQMADVKQIETLINDNLDAIIDIHQNVGYLTGKGTLALTQDMPPQLQMMQQQPQQETLERFNELLSREYSIKTVKLGEEDLPESIDTLIIAGPKETFSDWELYQIDQFLMQGKSLAIFSDSFSEIRQQQQYGGFQQPVYLPLNTGLDKLLNHYGVKIKKSYLLDENCYVNRGDPRYDEMPIYYAPIIQNEKINHEFPFMKNIKQLIVVKASPLEEDAELIKKNNLKLTSLFSSSDKGWEMSGRINLMPMFIQKPTDAKEQKSLPAAYLLEGEFPSYFSDKAVPERPKPEATKPEGEMNPENPGSLPSSFNSEDVKTNPKNDAAKEKGKEVKPEEKPVIREERVRSERPVITRGKPGKIFLIASSEMLKNSVLDEEGASPNAVFLLNAMDYLNKREDIAVMRGKNQRFEPLKDEISSFARNASKIVNTYGWPVLVIVFGIFVFFRRAARRRKIQSMFSARE